MNLLEALKLADVAIVAIREYEQGCNERRRKRSQDVFGHQGAFIPSAAPTDLGRTAAVAQALLRASAEAQEQERVDSRRS